MRGRKPKPTALHELHGNPDKRAPNRSEPRPVTPLPKPPPNMAPDARREWHRLSAQMYLLGLLSEIDRAAFAAYCQAFGRWQQAERALRVMAKKDPLTGGLLIQTSNGNAIQNPLVGVANKAMRDMVHFAAEFGMTPSARSRIVAEGRELPGVTSPGAQPREGDFERFLGANPNTTH